MLNHKSIYSTTFLILFTANLVSGSPAADSDTPESGYRQVVISEFGGPDVLSLVHKVDLPAPGKDQVRLGVLAAGVSFTDAMIRKGIYPGAEADSLWVGRQ